VSETVIAAIYLLHERSVDEIVAKLVAFSSIASGATPGSVLPA
jgi:hypothetical protein